MGIRNRLLRAARALLGHDNTAQNFNTMLSLVNPNDQPNISEMWRIAKDIDAMKLNMKAYGYELAQRMASALPPPRRGGSPVHIGITSKATTQADLETEWARYWCAELRMPLFYHRKVWEYVFVLQALHEAGALRPGAWGVGFGCATEPLPSYFASRGIYVLATDLPPQEAVEKGWTPAGEAAFDRDTFFRSDLVTRSAFDQHVKARAADMRNLPADIVGNDFCWSICALEHLGSISAGLEFVQRSLDTLRPGGVAVYTTEFNYIDMGKPIDNWPTVLFQQRHFEALAEKLTAEGHSVAPMDFDVGDKPLDRFIDLPPFAYTDRPSVPEEQWRGLWQRAHLKLNIDGFPCTCFGLIVRKRGG